MNFLKTLFRHTIGMGLALWVLVEDVFWGVFERFTAWISRLAWLKAIEKKLTTCPPYMALALFIVPGLVLLPFKLLGLWLMGNHQYALGILTFVAAKVVGTALGARLFVILKPTLLTLPWFATLWTKFLDWKTRVVAFAKTSYAYRAALVLKKKIGRWKQRGWRWAKNKVTD